MKRIYAVEDVKAGLHHNPLIMISDGEAIRSFTDAANNKETIIGAHPEDFRFWALGEYNEITGEIKKFSEPLMLINALQVVR